MFPNGAFGASLYEANDTISAYNISLEGREYLKEGYLDREQWQNEFNTKLSEIQSLHSDLNELRDYLSEEDRTIIDNFNTDNFRYISELNSSQEQFATMKNEALAAKERQLQEQKRKEQQQSRNSNVSIQQNYNNSSNNFKIQGVIYQNGIRYTYYSSRILYHYRTPEWTVGNDGIYRDGNGYIIVASVDYPQGAIVSTPFGAGKVYDSGCASGTIDIYTNF